MRTSSRLGYFLFHRPTDGHTSAVHVQRSGLWRSLRQCFLILLISFDKYTDRLPVRHYASGRQLVWLEQRETFSLL